VKVDDPPETEDPPVKVDDPPETEDPPVKVDDPPKPSKPEFVWIYPERIKDYPFRPKASMSARTLTWREFIYFARKATRIPRSVQNEAGTIMRRRKFTQFQAGEGPETPASGMSVELANAVADYYGARLPTAAEWKAYYKRHRFESIPGFKAPRSAEWTVDYDRFRKPTPSYGMQGEVNPMPENSPPLPDVQVRLIRD